MNSRQLRNTYMVYVTPMGAPRMTQRDKWKQRPVVLRYHAYRDELRARLAGFAMPAESWWIRFYMPMPKSKSKKWKQEHNEQPHQQKPDIDNLVKAFMDAMTEDDAYVHDIRASKFWSDEPRIEIEVLDPK